MGIIKIKDALAPHNVDILFLKENQCSQFKLNEENYDVSLNFNANKDMLVFRIEDLKEKILGNKRKGGKDNDLTIIDGNVYQIEVKYSNKALKRQKHNKQFKGGESWIKSVLHLIDSKNHCNIQLVYNILVCIRYYSKTQSTLREKKTLLRGMSRKNSERYEKNKDGHYLKVNFSINNKNDITLEMNNIIKKAISENEYHDLDFNDIEQTEQYKDLAESLRPGFENGVSQ